MVEQGCWEVSSTVTILFFANSNDLIFDTIGFINNLIVVVDKMFSTIVWFCVVTLIVSVIDIIENIIFILLGAEAINLGMISFLVGDKLIDKYMG